MMVEYRRQEGIDRWHFKINCSNWPTTNYKRYSGKTNKPIDGEFCSECQAKDRKK